MVKMLKEIREQPVVLDRCIQENTEVVKKIVEEINKRDIQWVYIAARGTSDHASIYGKYIIESEVGIPVALAAPSVFTLYNKTLKFKNGLVIAVSQSGKAADALEVIRSANKQDALTVSITNFPDSPLAQESKYHLYCNAGLEESVAATKTFTSEMMLFAQLTAEWAKNSTMFKNLLLVPENVSGILEKSSIIESFAPRYRFMDECFVLARGTNYAIAMESALKIQETTYARAKAFAISDFQHGPIAMIDRNIPVIIYAPDGPSFGDTSAMIDRLTESNIELIVVSNNESALGRGTSSFAIPQTDDDLISPFYNAVVAQLFACNLSLVKGLNPDTPRMLKKVTVTK
ncbi:MAG TPA: SIS domain-containing protein [Clostridiaceae bacterium]|nr:SIS domain-containing protein [Clostridiaceae bacterium]